MPAAPRSPAATPAARRARAALHGRVLLARHRRPLAAALLALAVATGVHAARPAAAGTHPVLVAARDLPAGHRLTAGDLAERRWADADVPDGLVGRPLGRVLGAPVRRGEPLTDARLGSGGRAAPALGGPADAAASAGRPPDGLVAVTVRLTDPASTLVARPGGTVDVLAGPAADPLTGSLTGAAATGKGATGSPAATVVVREAVVLAVPAAAAGSSTGAKDDGGTGRDAVGGDAVGGGLLGALSPSNSVGAADRGADALGGAAADVLRPPSGVVVVAVTASDALRLAAVAGVRTLSLARHAAVST